MPLCFVNSSIVDVSADIIVSPCNNEDFFITSAGYDISKKAGDKYFEYLENKIPPTTAGVYFSNAFDFPCKYIAHVSLPYWQENQLQPMELLSKCYVEVLLGAKRRNCHSVAFPLLGTGTFGFTSIEAVKTALYTINEFLSENEPLSVYVAILDKHFYDKMKDVLPGQQFETTPAPLHQVKNSLDYKLQNPNWGFYKTLLYYIDKKDLNLVSCYNLAGVDKRLFSKIKNTPNYLPSKDTVLRFAFALQLSLNQTNKLLASVGYTLSDSIPKDIIYKHFIETHNYNFEHVLEEIKARSL